MPRTSTKKRVPPLLHAAHDSIAAAWKQAARDLKPAFGKLGGAELDLERGIVSAVPGGVVSHVPVRLRRPMRGAELWKRPHVVAGMMTTRSLIDRLTEAVVLPGSYAVRLRPAGHDRFALDLHDAAGRRVLATGAVAKPMAMAARSQSLDCFGVDVDIDELDDIIDPFGGHVICVSFLEWRTCFDVPTWIWPR